MGGGESSFGNSGDLPDISKVFVSGFFVIICSLVGLCCKVKHCLSVLLCLEGLLLGVFFCFCFAYTGLDFIPHLILLVMGVCEASVALSLVVSMVRSHGNDYVLSLSSQHC